MAVSARFASYPFESTELANNHAPALVPCAVVKGEEGKRTTSAVVAMPVPSTRDATSSPGPRHLCWRSNKSVDHAVQLAGPEHYAGHDNKA